VEENEEFIAKEDSMRRKNGNRRAALCRATLSKSQELRSTTAEENRYATLANDWAFSGSGDT
jgi:hypothetical protein